MHNGKYCTDAHWEKLQKLFCRKDFELYGYDPEPFLWMASQDSETGIELEN